MRKFSYPIEKFNLGQELANIFGLNRDQLDTIHTLVPIVPKVGPRTDSNSIFHRVAYANIKYTFLPVYKKLIHEFISPLIGESIVYQTSPTIRFQLYPGNLAVGEFHKDSDYSHSTKEINIFLPLTIAEDTTTIWVESSPGKKDFSPLPRMDYGELMLWDGANLTHGSVPNESGKTRVSIDFRIMPLSAYNEEDGLRRSSIDMGKKFIIGDYFSVCEYT